ncbi:MAG: 2-phosphosulfolactate phosphatase [Candidatus Eremiobacterota bacterium]
MSFTVVPHPDKLPPVLPAPCRLVVIDVLRATTTIAAALHSGAEAVIPVSTVEEARAGAASGGLLAGERRAFRIEGFDLGNSPLEMTSERVTGRRVYLTTTNGTRALARVARWGPVLCASFVNLSRVAEALRGCGDVLILCSGSQASESPEDLAAAGALVDALDGEAPQAQAHHRDARLDLPGWLAATPHGEYLCRNGFGADVRFCATLDACPVLPVLRNGAAVLEYPLERG